MKKQQGFTLLELLVTMSIAAILTGIALPSFNGLIQRSRLTSNANLITGAFNFARSEAVKIGSAVIVEPGATSGWQVRDVTNNVILKVFDPSSQGITSAANAASITYQANGYREFGQATFEWTICNEDNEGRKITVSTGGSTSSEVVIPC